VVAALDATAQYDWRDFLVSRLDAPSDHAPLGGIEGSGWKLAFSETPNIDLEDGERSDHMTSEIHSIGVWLKDTGVLADVTPGMAAAAAGLAPGMKIVAVNGRRYSREVLRDAIKATQGGATRLELLVENADYFHTHVIDYAGGRRNPHLVRDESQPDLLSPILAPLAQGQGPH
jgi:predicted metalloprotease with PDZ domain